MEVDGGPGTADLRPPSFGCSTLAVCGERPSGAARNEASKTASPVVYVRREGSTRGAWRRSGRGGGEFVTHVTTSIIVAAPVQHFLE